MHLNLLIAAFLPALALGAGHGGMSIDIGPIRPEGIVMLPPGAGEEIGLGPGNFALVSEM